MSVAFAVNSIERNYAWVDDCPTSVLRRLVGMAGGGLAVRVQAAKTWRAALFNGRLPKPTAWPAPSVQALVCRALEDMGIVRFCKDQAELTDALLADIVEAFGDGALALQEEAQRVLARLQAAERKAQARAAAGIAGPRPPEQRQLSKRRLEELRRRARAQAANSLPDICVALKRT